MDLICSHLHKCHQQFWCHQPERITQNLHRRVLPQVGNMELPQEPLPNQPEQPLHGFPHLRRVRQPRHAFDPGRPWMAIMGYPGTMADINWVIILAVDSQPWLIDEQANFIVVDTNSIMVPLLAIFQSCGWELQLSEWSIIVDMESVCASRGI